MKAEKLISSISDEYISEALEAESSPHYWIKASVRNRLRVRPLLIFLLVLTVAVIPLVLRFEPLSVGSYTYSENIGQPPSGSNQKGEPETVTKDGSELLPGIMIYADITEPTAAEGDTILNTLPNINIQGYDSPTTAEGIRFKVYSKENRIDAVSDGGRLTGGINESYVFGFDELDFRWKAMTAENYWTQTATIRIYAVNDDRLMMRAVIEVSAKDAESFTAEVIDYESFSDVGGVVITEENEGKYYPGELTPVRAVDGRTLEKEGKLRTFSLRAGMPRAVRIDTDEERGQRMSSFDSPNAYTLSDLPAMCYDETVHSVGFTCCKRALSYSEKYRISSEISTVLADGKIDIRVLDPYYYSNNQYTIINVKEYDDESYYALGRLSVCISSEGKYPVIIFYLDKFERFENGIPKNKDNETDFFSSESEKKFHKLCVLLDERGFLEYDREKRKISSSEYLLTRILKDLISSYPDADIDTLADIMALRYYDRFPGYIGTHPMYARLEYEMTGRLSPDAPRLTLEKANEIINGFKEKVRGGSITSFDELKENDVIKKFEEITPCDLCGFVETSGVPSQGPFYIYKLEGNEGEIRIDYYFIRYASSEETTVSDYGARICYQSSAGNEDDADRELLIDLRYYLSEGKVEINLEDFKLY